MSELPMLYDVSLLLPVTMRVSAEDEADARAVAMSAMVRVHGAAGSLVAYSVGFPEAVAVKAVEEVKVEG